MNGFTDIITSEAHGQSLYDHHGCAPGGHRYSHDGDVHPVVLSYEHAVRSQSGTTWEERLPRPFWNAVVNRALAMARCAGKERVAIWVDHICKHQVGQDWIETGLLPYMDFEVLYISRPGIRPPDQPSYWVWLEEIMAIVGAGKKEYYYNSGIRKWEMNFVTREDLHADHRLATVSALVLDSVEPDEFESWSKDAARLKVWALRNLLHSRNRAHEIIEEDEPMTAQEICTVCRQVNVAMPRSMASKIRMAREFMGRRTWDHGEESGWKLPLILLPRKLLKGNLEEVALRQAHEDLLKDIVVRDGNDRAVMDMRTPRGITRIYIKFSAKDGGRGRISETRLEYLAMKLRDTFEEVPGRSMRWRQLNGVAEP